MEQQIRKFEGRIDEEQKKLMAGGLYPKSPFWALAKINLLYKIGEEMGVNVRIELDDMSRKAMRMRKWPLMKRYWFVSLLNQIYLLKDFFKRTHRLDGLKIWVGGVRSNDKMTDILRNYMTLTTYEPETTKLIKENVKSGDVCVDIGASIGYFTLQLARLGATVVAVEPTDFQQPYLKKNIKINGFKNVKQFQLGAWDKDETVRMPRNAPAYVQTELRCRPIDDLLEEIGISKVDFIKIDTDGAEPKVLKGLIRTIERSPTLKMVIEYYPKYVKDAGLDPEEMKKIINKYFKYTIIPADYSGDCENWFCTRK